MHRKHVYVNHRLVGEASTWPEVEALISAQGLTFFAKPAAVEGPSGFYVSGTLTEQSSVGLGDAFDVAERH